MLTSVVITATHGSAFPNYFWRSKHLTHVTNQQNICQLLTEIHSAVLFICSKPADKTNLHSSYQIYWTISWKHPADALIDVCVCVQATHCVEASEPRARSGRGWRVRTPPPGACGSGLLPRSCEEQGDTLSSLPPTLCPTTHTPLMH